MYKRDLHSLEKHGCLYWQLKELRDYCRDLKEAGISRYRQPIGAFIQQRNNAKRRGIGWELKLWDWWMIWQDSGHWDERGKGNGFVMARKGDVGPYSKDNVFIEWARRNNSERRDKTSGLPMGVIKQGMRYGAHAMKNGKMKWLGIYSSPEEAEMAYLIAIGT
jgi:hypothetical protein